jgi:hypothetical protein
MARKISMQFLSKVTEKTVEAVTTRTYEIGTFPAVVTATIAGFAAAGSFGNFLLNFGVLHKLGIWGP